MHNYIKNVSDMCHDILRMYCKKFDVALDATLGNGNDSIFLSSIFKKVYSFEIQNDAVNKFLAQNLKNVEVILDSHENVEEYIKEPIDAVIYNLGYLPKGDKSITTKEDSTIKSLKSTIKLLNTNGIATICAYKGHDEGLKEYISILDLLSSLDKKMFRVMKSSFLNMNSNAPEIFVIEKGE